jgi:glycerol-3-phosphate acyltransferase PlsY
MFGIASDALPGLAVALALGYLAGSIPSGLLLTRYAGLGDIRSVGSGNIGATNVLRTGHRGLALATFLADAAKGAVAVLIGFLVSQDIARAAGLGAVIGHIFPVWLRFSGGKGVATYLGVLIALYWPVGLAFAVVWATVAWRTRLSSLAALSAIIVCPILLFGLGEGRTAAVLTLASVLVFIRHHANLRRLLRGEESRIGER